VPEESEEMKLEKRTCKICLGDQESEEDFFVSPCKCKGTCEFVHYYCLKKWVESKVSKK
jgi:E3 ubiquitin-protein ligase DOA10